MKLEKGMYVRTPLGIAKYLGKAEYESIISGETIKTDIDEFDKLDVALWSEDVPNWVFKHDTKNVVLKASHNIIDLLEVGDVITFKNDEDVYKINCIPNYEYGNDDFYLVFDYAKQFDCEDIRVTKEEMKEILNSIVTKEQFESMSYKVEDK